MLIAAIEPPLALAEALVLAQEATEVPLRHLGAELKATPPEQLRLVLRVWPGRDEAALPRLRDGLRSIAAGERPLELRGVALSFHPSDTQPRLLLAEVEGGETLAALRRRVAALSDACGLAPERAPWEPRVVVGRVASREEGIDLRGVVGAAGRIDDAAGTSRELVLLRADARVHGGWPRVIDRFELGSGR
jgi:2'-5' RNA ligase